MIILAVETSCDETAISIIDAEGGLSTASFKVLANITASQAELHAKYGGVFPMLAKREHGKNLIPLLKAALTETGFLKTKLRADKIHSSIQLNTRIVLEREKELAGQFTEFIPNIEKPPIDRIAVTYGPGLEPALWVGINFAKALALIWEIPVIPINHMEGHIFSAMLSKKNLQPITYNLQPIKFPALALLISGGHTELVLMRDWFKYEIVGRTRDDAAGEAFDKVARLLGLPYPGGPEIYKLARQGNPGRVKLPRPMIKSGDFDFSFAGLKTAVLYTMKKLPHPREQDKANIAREFEQAVTDVLMSKTISAVKKYKVKTLVLGGGVSANTRIRETITRQISERTPSVKLYLPEQKLTTDNALMIGVAGYLRALGIKKKSAGVPKTISASGNLTL